MDSSIAASIALRAAECLAPGRPPAYRTFEYSCVALSWSGATPTYLEKYAELFSPVAGVAPGSFWLDYTQPGWRPTTESKYLWRLTALCFLAAMCDAGDF